MKNTKKEKHLHRIAFILLSIYLSIPQIGKREINDSYFDSQISIDNTEQSTLLLHAVDENLNLTEEEKEFLYQFKDLLEENPYLDCITTYQAMNELDIIYTTRGKEYPEKIVGIYIPSENVIKIFSKDNNLDTLIHEIIHCIFMNQKEGNLPEFFIEGMTELLANEYFEENPFLEENSYPFEITMVKILCDIVGPDIVLKSYSTGNKELLEEAISNKLGSNSSSRLLDNIDQLFKKYESGIPISEEEIKAITTSIDPYYHEKVEVDSIEYEMYLYNRSMIELLSTENPDIYYLFRLMSEGYYTKTYFSQKLQAKYPSNIKVLYKSDLSNTFEKQKKKEVF